MDYQKLILRIKCPEIRACPFQEPMSCTKCRGAIGEDSVFAIKELLSRVEELEAKNKRLEEAQDNTNVAPVVHGEWKYLPFYKRTSMGVIECQACKAAFEGSIGFNFCPNCGAKMDL